MILSQAIKEYMDRSVLCWLASSNAEGQPNVSPKEIFTYWQDDKVLIANVASPQSIRNIKENPLVCVSFIDIWVQKGFQLKGSAQIISAKDPLFTNYHQVLLPIAGPDFPFKSVIEIQIEKTKPIIAPRYLLYPETTEAAQIKSARKTYKV